MKLTTIKNNTLLHRRSIIIGLSLTVVIVFWGLATRHARHRAARTNVGLTTEVKRGPLTISLVESGTIRNRKRVIVRSEVEGSRTIIQVVKEGEMVQAGDLLVELDSSSLEEQRLEQAARVQNSKAALTQSRESLEVARNQAEADVAKAELDLRFAILALEQYEKGEYPRQLQQTEASITIADEELQLARDNLEWSRKLEPDGYITRAELEADELALKRRQLDLQLAISARDLLIKYTHVQALEKSQSDIEQAEMALERVKRRARADIIRAESDLKSKEYDLQHQRNRLARTEDQITKCRIVAPADGMVIYATSVQAHRWRRVDPLEQGQTVRERQELIHLPTTDEMMAEISIQEASLPKIRTGLPALITLDSDPDKAFRGRLARIGILPDSVSMALNPDLKLYNCEIIIENDTTALRQGMSCNVELIVEQHSDVLFMPLQALTRVNGIPTAYVVGARGIVEPRAVLVGQDNGRMVHIFSGLEEGDKVLLAPPLAESVQHDESARSFMDKPDAGNGDEPASIEPHPQSGDSGEPRQYRESGRANRPE